MKEKPQLHQSHIDTLFKCGEQFHRIYILGHKAPPGVALLLGRSAHKVAQRSLTHKAQNKGLPMSIDFIKDVARDEFVKVWNESPVILDDDEKAKGLDKVRDTCIDESVKLATLHLTELAPKLSPKEEGIERQWVIECGGYPYNLSGTMDVDEEKEIIDGTTGKLDTVSILRDLKTANKNPGQRTADFSEQFSYYAMAKYVIDKKIPDQIWADNLVKSTATREPYLTSYKTHRNLSDFMTAKARFERACLVIDKGIFTPARSTDWWCSVRFCGFAANGSCKFFNSKRVFVSLSKSSKTGGKHEPRKATRAIKKGTDAWRHATE